MWCIIKAAVAQIAGCFFLLKYTTWEGKEGLRKRGESVERWELSNKKNNRKELQENEEETRAERKGGFSEEKQIYETLRFSNQKEEREKKRKTEGNGTNVEGDLRAL